MLLIQPFKITKTHTRTFNLYNNTTTHTFRCSTFNNCILTVSKTTIIVSYFFNCLHVPQHISISHIFKTKSIFRIFIIYLFSLFYVTVRLSFWSTVPKPRKVATNINSYKRYRNILFQKVASGYPPYPKYGVLVILPPPPPPSNSSPFPLPDTQTSDTMIHQTPDTQTQIHQTQ